MIRNDVMNIQLAAFWWCLFSTVLTSKVISAFGCSAGFFPRTKIIKILSTLPPGTISALDIFGTPFAITFARTKRAIFCFFYYFFFYVHLFFALLALCLNDSIFLLILKITTPITVFTRFFVGDISKDNKVLTAILTDFFNFRLSFRIFHNINLPNDNSYVKYNSGKGRFNWRELKSQ